MSKLLLILSLSAVAVFAKGGPMGMRMGGVGYLMPDGNDFTNASQMPMTMGLGIQGLYSTIPATSLASATPSAVWGNGAFGLGAYASRSGTSLTDSTKFSDSIGGAFGFSMVQRRMSIGVGYGRSIGVGQSNDGILRADLALNAPKGSGFIFGAGGSTTLNSVISTRTFIVGAGYQFSHNNAVEAVYEMNDLDNKDDTTLSGFVTLGGRIGYLGLGFNYLNLAKQSQGAIRGGLRLGNRFDVSAFTTHTFSSGSNPLYGGSARVMF